MSDATTNTPRCRQNTALSLHTGYDDWSNLVLPISISIDAEDAPVNPVQEPEPTVEEQQALGRALTTTDLAVAKTVVRPVAVAGWDKLRFTDQFDTARQASRRDEDRLLCNPVEKNGEPIPNPDAPHLM
ncbi:MAG: hypothetical protein P8X90_34110 [Desulfobacterales bacterium]